MKSFKDHIKEGFAPINQFKDATKHFTKVDTRDEHQGWRGTADELMAQYGFHYNGSGKSAAVYSKKGYPYVIKVFMRDTPYLKWLHFCQQNQNNPYVPKIRGKVLQLGLFNAVRLEKLYDYRGRNGYAFAADELDDAAESGDVHAKAVYDFLDKNIHIIDIHNGNFMIRNPGLTTGQIVCIDPFYNFFKNGQFSMDPDDISAFKSLF